MLILKPLAIVKHTSVKLCVPLVFQDYVQLYYTYSYDNCFAINETTQIKTKSLKLLLKIFRS